MILIVSATVGCSGLSEQVRHEAAGMNGGFEVVSAGLPVNWNVYTNKTLPSGDYDLVIDTVEVRSGKQSLKFVVRTCEPDGGWRSPGFSQEFAAEPGATYTVGFWARNAAADFLVRVSFVSANESAPNTMVWSNSPLFNWKHFEQSYTVPSRFNRIRFEANVVRPGIFWIDDVTITRAEARP